MIRIVKYICLAHKYIHYLLLRRTVEQIDKRKFEYEKIISTTMRERERERYTRDLENIHRSVICDS